MTSAEVQMWETVILALRQLRDGDIELDEFRHRMEKLPNSFSESGNLAMKPFNRIPLLRFVDACLAEIPSSEGEIRMQAVRLFDMVNQLIVDRTSYYSVGDVFGSEESPLHYPEQDEPIPLSVEVLLQHANEVMKGLRVLKGDILREVFNAYLELSPDSLLRVLAIQLAEALLPIEDIENPGKPAEIGEIVSYYELENRALEMKPWRVHRIKTCVERITGKRRISFRLFARGMAEIIVLIEDLGEE